MNTPLRQVRRVSVVDEIVEQMKRRILSGEWPPGTVLPSLRAFAAETGVSMLTVREGIRTLQAERLVETRHGVGTFVLSPLDGSPWKLGVNEVDEYLDLTEAREVIEGAIIEFATQRRTEEQLVSLEQILEQMRAARKDTEAFLEADSEFHIALAEAAHNNVLLHSMLAIRGPLRRFMLNRNLEHLETHGHLDGPISDHEEIVTALRSADAAASIESLHRITQRGRDHLAHLRTDHPA